jgi:hypothetical protein
MSNIPTSPTSQVSSPKRQRVDEPSDQSATTPCKETKYTHETDTTNENTEDSVTGEMDMLVAYHPRGLRLDAEIQELVEVVKKLIARLDKGDNNTLLHEKDFIDTMNRLFKHVARFWPECDDFWRFLEEVGPHYIQDPAQKTVYDILFNAIRGKYASVLDTEAFGGPDEVGLVNSEDWSVVCDVFHTLISILCTEIKNYTDHIGDPTQSK